MTYPSEWPRCPSCGDFALDGHLTCGRATCDERAARDSRVLNQWVAFNGDAGRTVVDVGWGFAVVDFDETSGRGTVMRICKGCLAAATGPATLQGNVLEVTPRPFVHREGCPLVDRLEGLTGSS